jgi:predicted house-cleaning noncanonical NTP pyrophosphatase (MazG superfamily)
MEYNKLVRDKIPEIIENDGHKAVFHKATENEYLEKLSEKLREEIGEFLAEYNGEELADVLEVIYTIAKIRNIDLNEVEEIRKDKLEARGGFDKKIILDSTA